MPWFRHHYSCETCDGHWLAEAAFVVEGDCPFCGARDSFPYKSDDRTMFIEKQRKKFVVLEACRTTGNEPDYRKRQSFATRAEAEAFLANRLTHLAKQTYSLTLDRLKKSA